MPTRTSSQRHPLESLLLLLGLAIAGAVIFTVISLLVAKAVYPDSNLQDALAGKDPASLGYMKIIQIFSTIGTFIVPALVFGWLESGSPGYYLHYTDKFPAVLAILAIVILFASYPVLEYSVILNQKMKLPGALKGIEEWMRQKEDEMALLTRQLLAVKTIPGLAVNLVMIAVLPAIGEEFIFRGCLQNILWRWAKNYHLAIWITAFIFSAIHFQFFGFLPRMLLGALLGYLFIWGKSIWLPIMAHFANNAASVIAAYIYYKRGDSLDSIEEAQSYSALIYIISIGLTVFLLWQYYRVSKVQDFEEQITDTDGEQLG